MVFLFHRNMKEVSMIFPELLIQAYDRHTDLVYTFDISVLLHMLGGFVQQHFDTEEKTDWFPVMFENRVGCHMMWGFVLDLCYLTHNRTWFDLRRASDI